MGVHTVTVPGLHNGIQWTPTWYIICRENQGVSSRYQNSLLFFGSKFPGIATVEPDLVYEFSTACIPL
jgi:hypothetical protein